MKIRLFVILIFSFSFLLHAEPTPQQNYLVVYLELSDGKALDNQKNYLGALVHFKVAGIILQRMRDKYPNWEITQVAKCISDCRKQVVELEPLAEKQVRDKTRGTLTSRPPISVLYDQGLKEPDTWKAMNEIEEYLTTLEIMHQEDPQWEAKLIEDRIKSAKQEMDRLETNAFKTVPPADGRATQERPN